MRLIIVGIILFLSVSATRAKETVTLTGPSGSFNLTQAEYLDLVEKQYNINTNTQSCVTLSMAINTEPEYDFIYLYECDDQFGSLVMVGQYSGNKTIQYSSRKPNGKLVLKFVSDFFTSGKNGFTGFTANYGTTSLVTSSIPTSNTLSNTANVIIGEETNAINLHLFDSKEKNLGGIRSTNDFSKSMLLLESNTGSKTGLTFNKMASNESFELRSDASLLLSSNLEHKINTPLLSVSTPAMEDVFTIKESVAYVNHLIARQGGDIGVGNNLWAGSRIRIHHNGKHAYIDFLDNINFRVNGSNITPLIIQGDGNVAIGYGVSYNTDGTQYQTEGYKLAVKGSTLFKGDVTTEGTIKATEIKVEAQTADFVFEDTYHLKDLSEVEAFIKANKHLPEIPSAVEMEEAGVNLAEMNKMLLMKVEELTLYAIAKDKEVNSLKSDMKEKSQQLENVESRLEAIEKMLRDSHK